MADFPEPFVTDDSESLLGAGLRYRFAPLNLSFDYAYERHEFFTDVNRFTLSVQF